MFRISLAVSRLTAAGGAIEMGEAPVLMLQSTSRGSRRNRYARGKPPTVDKCRKGEPLALDKACGPNAAPWADAALRIKTATAKAQDSIPLS
jgi:hypothetical protein